MLRAEDVAVAFESDWNGWGIAIVATISVLAVAWVLGSRRTLAWISYRVQASDAGAIVGYGLWGLLTLAALIVLLVMPGTIMRHLPDHGTVGWVVGGSLLVAIVLAFWAGGAPSIWGRGFAWVPFLPAIVVALGAAIGWIVDGVTRVAASVPMAVGTFVLLIVGGVIALFLYLRTQ